MLRSRILRISLQWTKLPSTGNTAFQLLLHFLRGALFQRVSAAAQDQPGNCERDCEGLHPLILGTKPVIANKLVL
jgi:hypothetical protein